MKAFDKRIEKLEFLDAVLLIWNVLLTGVLAFSLSGLNLYKF